MEHIVSGLAQIACISWIYYAFRRRTKQCDKLEDDKQFLLDQIAHMTIALSMIDQGASIDLTLAPIKREQLFTEELIDWAEKRIGANQGTSPQRGE